MAIQDKSAEKLQQIINTLQGRSNLGPNDKKRLQDAKAQLSSLQGSNGGNQALGGNPPILDQGAKFNNPVDAINNEAKVQDYAAEQGIKYGNVNQVGPAGSRTYTRDANGNFVQTDKLSDNQQGIFNRDEALSTLGRDYAQGRLANGSFNQDFNPNLPPEWVPQDTGEARQKYFKSAYDLAIGNTERNYKQEKEDLATQLYNRGIPESEIANRPEMQQFEDRYQNTRNQAANQATVNSGDEYQRDFGIQEQLRANRFSQQQGTRNQNLNEVNTFTNFGQGFQNPNFQGFQGVGYNLPSPTDIYQGQQNLNLQKKQLNAAIAQAGRQGGGAAPAPAQPQSPFIV